MIKFGTIAMALMALALGGCATSPRAVSSDPRAAEFKSSIAAPPGLARVYILPTFSKGLFTDLEGHARLAIFREGAELGAKLGVTGKTSFVAFDIGAGTYDILAYGDDPMTRVTRPIQLEAGKVYFLRPAFFRSVKEMGGPGLSNAPGLSSANGGMAVDTVDSAVAGPEIRQLAMAALDPEGEVFLQKTRQAIPAPAPSVMPVMPPVATPMPASPPPLAPPAPAAMTAAPPADSGDSFAVIERKLKEIKQLRHEGLITQPEYDAKRKAILNAY